MSNGDPYATTITPQALIPPKSSDPYAEAVRGQDPYAAAFLGKRPPLLPTFAQAHPALNAFVVRPMRSVAQLITYALTGRTITQGAPPAGTKYRTVMGRGGPEQVPEDAPPEQDMAEVREGAALMASFMGGPAVEGTPIGPLLGHWGSFLAGEAVGGATYGAIRPLGPDEDRASSVMSNAAIFTAFGGGIRGAAELASFGLKRYILSLKGASRDAALRLAQQGIDGIERDLSRGGVTLGQLPADARARLEEPILRQAVAQADPNAIDLDGIIARQNDAAIEIHPRVAGAGPVTIPEAPVSIDNEFTEVMAKLKAARAKFEARTAEDILPPRREYIVGPTVQGKSGKLYIGAATHPGIMDLHIGVGVPEGEFEGIDAQHPGRGFRTSERDFVSRDEAAKILGNPEPLFSEDLHKAGETTTGSPPVADLKMSNVADDIIASQGGPGSHEAFMDAATDKAVAHMKPLETAEDGVREEAALVQTSAKSFDVVGTKKTPPVPAKGKTLSDLTGATAQQELAEKIKKGPKVKEPHLIPGVSAAKAKALTQALRDGGTAAEHKVILEMTEPNPETVAQIRMKGKTPHEVNRIRDQLVKSLEREVPEISLNASELIKADWAEGDKPLTTPAKMNGFEIAVRLRDETLEGLSKQLESFAKSRGGFASGRLLLLMTGSSMEGLGLFSSKLSDGQKTGLEAVGSMFILAAIGPQLAEWTKPFVKRIVEAYNPEYFMSGESKETFRQYWESLAEFGSMRRTQSRILDQVFPDESSKRAAMYVLDEGPNAPEWHSLTADQQKEALVLHQINLRLGVLLEDNGVLSEYQENYVRHLLPPESYQRWKTAGYKVLPTGGAFTKERVLSLRELEAWAQKQGVKGPILDPAVVHAYHLNEAGRALSTVRLIKVLENKGIVVDKPESGFVPFPDGYRPIGVLNLSGKMAPEAVAKALENISSPRSSNNALINAADTIKSTYLKGVMFWWWEHGFNVMRAAVALSWDPARLADVYGKYIKDADAVLAQGARHGLNIADRPDIEATHDAAQKLFSKIGMPGHGAAIDRILERQDRLLWDRLIPNFQGFAYALELDKWGERTGYKFGEGTPEFKAAARRAANYANTLAGRVPTALQDPGLARGMRLLMFSPRWTTSRMGLMAHAWGELGDIASGKLDAKDAMYLPFKLRQAFAGVALTAAGSLLLSGKLPEFNPSTDKFYMRTGKRDANGREIGLDLLGWWQDDFKLFHAPLDYIGSRLNPLINVAYETVKGRDYLGRQMDGPQRIGNILSQLGPPEQAVEDLVRVGEAAFGHRPITAGEALQMASRTTAAFRTATLPRPIDVAIAKYAKKILNGQGIPSTDDNAFELSRLLRANVLAGHDLIDNRVVTYLAYKRRAEVKGHPIGAYIESLPSFSALWQESRHVLSDF